MNKPNQYNVCGTAIEIHEIVPIYTTDKSFDHKSDVTQYKNDSLIVYLSDDEDSDAEPAEYLFGSDFIKTDLLGEVDADWKEKYQTRIRPEDVTTAGVLLISPDRLAQHRDGTEPLTWREMHRHRAIQMWVRLRPRKTPRASKALRKLRRKLREIKAEEAAAALLKSTKK